MFQDDASQTARSILFRRLSSHPTTPPASNRKGSMRTVKSNVGGTSPHSIQRRRTTASHTGRAILSSAPDHLYQRRQPHESGYRSKDLSRPVSWHPHSRSFDTPAGYCPTSEPTLRNTIAGLQSLAVTSMRPAAGDPPIHDPIPTDPIYTLNPPSITTGSAFGGLHDGSFSIDAHTMYVPQPSYAWPSQHHGYLSNTTPSYGPGLYPPAEMQQSSWSAISDQCAPIPFQAPDFLPVQYPSETPTPWALDGDAQLPRKRSKELVGMGLYDHPDEETWSELDYDHSSFLYHLASPHRESTGKGLKLEETWEPPKDADGAEDDEAYSSDEAEEDLPGAANMSQGPSALDPAFSDLSNQSFFFDNDDPYSVCVALGQALPPCQPKGPDPARANFLWC